MSGFAVNQPVAIVCRRRIRPRRIRREDENEGRLRKYRTKGAMQTMGRRFPTRRSNSSAEALGGTLGIEGISGSPEPANGGNREPKNRIGAWVCCGAPSFSTNLDESSIDDAVIGWYPISTDFKFWRFDKEEIFLVPRLAVASRPPPYQSITYLGAESERDGEAARKKAIPIQELTAILMAEVMEYARVIKIDRICMLCPFREFIRPCRVRANLGIYRKKENKWRFSGT